MTAAASQTHPASLGILTKLNTSMIRIASELTSIPFRKRLGVNRLLNERVGGFLKRARGSPAWQRVYVKPSDLHPSRLQVNFIQFPIAVEPDGEARDDARDWAEEEEETLIR